jgi:hypothetical protein
MSPSLAFSSHTQKKREERNRKTIIITTTCTTDLQTKLLDAISKLDPHTFEILSMFGSQGLKLA